MILNNVTHCQQLLQQYPKRNHILIKVQVNDKVRVKLRKPVGATKKNILSGGRHLLSDGRHIIFWRPPHNFLAAAT